MSQDDLGAALASLHPRVAAAVRRTCPPWMSGHADDLTQEVLKRLLIYLRRDEGNRTFSSIYLEKAAYGAMVDEIRRQARRREEPVSDVAALDSAPATALDPEQTACGHDVGRSIRACLLRMNRPRRLAVTLYLLGCTVPEAGRRLGWTAKRAENLVYRGLAALRACLRSRGVEP